MPRNEDFSNALWADLDDLSNDAVLLYVWSWTNPRCGMAGIYTCPRRLLLDGRLDDQALSDALSALDGADKMRFQSAVVYVPARIKRLRMLTEQIATSIDKDLDSVGRDHPLAVALVDRYHGYSKQTKNGEVRLNLKRTSGEPQIPHNHAGSLNLTRTSTEVPLSGEGLGTGPLVVDQILARLREVSLWTVDDIRTRQAVENAISSYPDRDPLAAAAKAVALGLDTSWRKRDAGGTFWFAMSDQKPSEPDKPKKDYSQYNRGIESRRSAA